MLNNGLHKGKIVNIEIPKNLLDELLELLVSVELGKKTSNNRMAFQVYVELLSIIIDNIDNSQKESEDM